MKRRVTVEDLIERGRADRATNYERWLGDQLVQNPKFRQRMSERLARGRG